MDAAAVGRCIASVVRKLNARGQFLVSWLENATAAGPEADVEGIDPPIVHSFAFLTTVAEAAGATIERLDAPRHPRGDSVAVLTRHGPRITR
jgi:hypothetical protein